MVAKIDWRLLAQQVGSIKQNSNSVIGSTQIGSSELAKQAIEHLLGEENLRSAVDYYISQQPGSELVRNILWQLHPCSAMQYCYDLYKSPVESIDIRRSAVELLRVVADYRVLPWIYEFLEDDDSSIQAWGVGVLDQLLFSNLVHAEDVRVEELLRKIIEHPSAQVRQTAETLGLSSYLESLTPEDD
jgi:hypothetical protein